MEVQHLVDDLEQYIETGLDGIASAVRGIDEPLNEYFNFLHRNGVPRDDWRDVLYDPAADGFRRYLRGDGNGLFDVLDGPDGNIRTYTADGLYAQALYGVLPRWTVGLRYDDHDGFGSELTYRFAPMYVHRDTDTRFKASVATGFKAPTLFQTDGFTPNNFGSFYRGNPDLGPEKSFAWEIGMEQMLWGKRMRGGGVACVDLTVT